MMTRPRALLAAVLAAATAVCLVVVSGGSSTSRASATEAIAVGRVHASYQPTHGKIFVLVIGTDAREGNPVNANGDAIHLLGFNTVTMRGGILNFPRDCWVNIPGHGTGKINSSLSRGGPRLMAKTIESLTGIRIGYWVMTGFHGFQGALAHLGHLKMRIPPGVNDVGFSGAQISAGVHRLPAYKVLQYARDRHDFPGGDLTRSHHQGDILLAMLRMLRNQVSGDPGRLMRWIAVTRRYTRTSLAPAELFRLGILASQVDPRRVRNVNVPVSLGSVGSADVDFIKQAPAHALYRRFKSHASL